MIDGFLGALHALLIPLEGGVPEFPDETPWWAVWWYWIVSPLIVAIPTTVLLLVTRANNKRELAAASEKLDTVQEQVANTHTTNLRVDIDEAKASSAAAEAHAADAKNEAGLAKESSHRTERLVRDLITTMRALEHAVDRRDQLHADAMGELDTDVRAVRQGLTEHLAEVPRIIEDALTRHVGDCPARQAHTD